MPDPNTEPATGQRRRTAPKGKSDDTFVHAAGDVTQGVMSDLATFPTDLRAGALAATALSLAGSIDDPSTSATARSMCARALLDTLETLRDLCPPAKEADGLDDLSARRTARIARSAVS